MSSPKTTTSGKLPTISGRTARRLLASTAAVAAAVGMTASSGGAAAASGGSRTRATSHAPTRDVIANLFEWNWRSVSTECTTVLGPKGYGGVQVAPPQDSLSKSTGTPDNPAIHPWWEVYQPVDYRLTSRMGNEAQFRSMVATCRKAGVKVYVDAVINHMTGQGHTSYGGVTYRKYHYDGLYGFANFHHTPSDGVNLIGFSRGSRGWIGINNGTTARTRTFRTGLAAGTYCDIIHGDAARGACSGPTVTVAAGGSARVTVPAKDAVAFDVTDLVRG